METTTFLVPQKYVVFRSENTGEHRYIEMSVNHMLLQVDETFTPILYTNRRQVAIEVVNKLECSKWLVIN